MSLRPDDRSGRGRSKSPAGRDRDRSRSAVRVPHTAAEAPRTASYVYPQASPAMPGSFGGTGITSPSYENNAYFPASTAPHQPPYGASATAMPYPEEENGFTMGGYTDFPPHERPGYVPPSGFYPPPGPPPRRGRQEKEDDDSDDDDDDDDDLAYGAEEPKRERLNRHSSYSNYQRPIPGATTDPRSSAGQFQYARAPDKIRYTAKPKGHTSPPAATYSSTPLGQPQPQPLNYSSTPQGQFPEQLPRTYAHNAYDRDAHVVDITPGRETLSRHNSEIKSGRPSNLDYPPPLPVGLGPPPRSPGLAPRLNTLSVSNNGHGHVGMGGGLPPPSPLLEAYHGTYQSISPMPLALRPADDDDLSDLEPLEPALSHRSSHQSRPNDKLARELAARDRASSSASTSKHGKHDTREKEPKRVKLYDGEEDAKTIASALNHHKPDADALCDVIPRLSHDHILEVRRAYKKLIKVQGKGVNLSKHINMKLSGSMFGKAVYVTALGRWESEGYWANFFYQSHGSRRELLIEALMGRTNAEIREIKEDFRDKRYGDSLVKCMEKELKMDKFRTAVLMVLEERRQEEQDAYPMEYVHRDVDALYQSVRAQKGGESAMLEIIVRRSDAHLREVLRAYEKMFGENFARAALKKSNNLVGEVIAHILNGVINKPARDALLLQHAIRDIADKNKDDELRYELLISRIVRIHWDRMHLMRVKKEYYDKYRINLEDAINDATKGDFREFMCELCETR